MRNDIDLKRRNIGINFKDDTAHVRIWSPLSENIQLKMEGKTISLDKDEFGYWTTFTNEVRVGDRYKIIVNYGQEFPDPTSVYQPEGVHGRSAALDISTYKWTDDQWNNIPLKDYILYELHTGTFTEDGTFEAIEEKLDYLLELGVNAIEIMPVAQFPGSRNWGYDGVFPFAVQDSYGGPKALKHLVNACHQKGIAVVLDVVYNHMGPEGNYLGALGPYFTGKYNTPWGNAINFDDEYCDGVRTYFIENALMWFRDFHIDALRMDAVHAIKDFSPIHILREMKLHVNELMQQTGRQHHLIVELDLNDTKFINPIEQEGFGMDAQWIDEFHHALRVAAGGERTGYYNDFDGLQHLAKAYKDAYVFNGQYSPHRKKKFGVKTENPGHQFIVFSQNHDQVGNRMLGERTSELVSYEMQKLMAAAVVVSPYLPMLFMGEEYAETNRFMYFVSHTDQELAEAVRKGRKEEFAAFHAQGEAPDPVSEETFRNSKLQWELLKEKKHQKMFWYYKHLLQMRKEQTVLRHLNRRHLDVQVNEEKQTLILNRWYGEEHIVCFMNFFKEQQVVQATPHAQQWNKLFASCDEQWLGPADAKEQLTAGEEVMLQPESIIVYTNRQNS